MSIDVEYAIKKDVRNNPVVRDVDEKQRRTLARGLVGGALIVGLVLLTGWQHYQIIDSSYHVERLAREFAEQEALNRRLRLEVEALRAPALIERRAMSELHMAYPTPAQTLLVERVRAATPPRAAVAMGR